MKELEKRYPKELYILDNQSVPTDKPGNKKMVGTLKRIDFSDSRETLENLITVFKLAGGEFCQNENKTFYFSDIKEGEYVLIKYMEPRLTACYYASPDFRKETYIWNKLSKESWFNAHLNNFGLYRYIGVKENPNFKKILAKIIRTKQKNRDFIKSNEKITKAFRNCQSIVISKEWLKKELTEEIKALNFDENRVSFMLDYK